MTRLIILAALSTLVLAISAPASQPVVNATKNLTSMPLAFTENQGQWDSQVLFRTDAGGATMWFGSDGAYYQFTRRTDDVQSDMAESSGWMRQSSADEHLGGFGRDKVETMLIKASFVGANPGPVMHGEDLLDYRCNYFLGSDPAGWRTDVANYGAIVYEQIYPGVDLKYYGNGREMEYDFIVSPGADPARIRVQYEGVESISVNAEGELVVKTQWGEVIERRPVVYQTVSGERVPIEGRYELAGGNSFGFSVGAGYDPTLPLVIDPILSYSTYLGGSARDWCLDVAVDATENAYVVGETYSADFPTLNPYQTYQAEADVFVTKLNSDGNGLVYSTYLGGSGIDQGEDMAVDESGAVYLVGETSSSDFPTVNAFQWSNQGGYDAFVAKLSSAGNSLIYSSYLGGSYNEVGWGGLALDASGAVYISGNTESDDFPTVNPFQTWSVYWGMWNAFISKIASDGSYLVYSTYLGGNGDENAHDIAIDGDGSAYVTGSTTSSDFPLQYPYSGFLHGYVDAFVTKLSAAGNSLVYSTYLGGYDFDEGFGILVDGAGAAHVTGNTISSDFPTRNPYQGSSGGGSDAFITKLHAFGNSLTYSTYLGGSSDDLGWSIALKGTGEAYLTGYTSSTDFPLEGPYQSTYQGGIRDVFVAKLSGTGTSLEYSTYLGGNGEDYGKCIVLDGSGEAYVTGETASTDFPTLDPYQSTYQGGDFDGFVTKLSDMAPSPPVITTTPPTEGYVGELYLYDVDATGVPDPTYELTVAPSGMTIDEVTGLIEWTMPFVPDDYDVTVVASNGILPDDEQSFVISVVVPCCELRGDLDDNEQVDVLDLDYFIDWLYRTGPAPDCEEEANVDGSSQVDVLDVNYFINWLYRSGPDLVPCP